MTVKKRIFEAGAGAFWSAGLAGVFMAIYRDWMEVPFGQPLPGWFIWGSLAFVALCAVSNAITAK